jgi:integrase
MRSTREAVCTSYPHPFGRLIRAATLPVVRIHDMRHSLASQLVIAGVPLRAVQELLGLADIKMTTRFAHLAPGAKAAYVSVRDGEPSRAAPNRLRRATRGRSIHSPNPISPPA